jgi:hypothetical protein
MAVQSLKRQRGFIRGSGGGKGGGGQQRVPVEAPDTLRARQFARVLDLISEGEVGGLVANLESVKIDGTPLQNPDGTMNFQGVTFYSVPGTQEQGYIPGFLSVESEGAVGVEVKEDRAVARQFTNPDLDQVRVTVTIPQLTQQDRSNGDLNGTEVEYAIDLQSNGAGYKQVHRAKVNGKTTSTYPISDLVNLEGDPPWDIRVRRVTPDSTDVTVQNKLVWSSYTQIVLGKFRYPNSAINALEIAAEQFPNIPTRSYDMYGIICLVPDNYDPITREYTGVWTGTFKYAWTDNPAWCYYDMMVNNRYGLGDYVESTMINKFALYAIAQYCDELVDDGQGGLEPRFTCNLYLQTREEAFKVITNMASIFRGMTFWHAGSITAVSDMTSSPVYAFSPANVEGGVFDYEGTDKQARHTVALVTWNDPNNGYKQEIEFVPDIEGVRRYGINETSIASFGCTSRGQAHRAGKWLLYSERMETESIKFNCGLEGVPMYPGAIIKVTDPSRAGKRMGGRLQEATANSATLDDAVDIEVGKTYQLIVILQDGTLATRDVTTGIGSHTVLGWVEALPSLPQKDAPWFLMASDLVPETWKVLDVQEIAPNKLQVVGIAHEPNKFTAIEQDLSFEPPPTSLILAARPEKVTNLVASETVIYDNQDGATSRVILSWTGGTGRYRVSYRHSLGNWNALETNAQSITLDNLEPGAYTFNVTQMSMAGRESNPEQTQITIVSRSAPPPVIPDVGGLEIFGQGSDLEWTGRDLKVGWRRSSMQGVSNEDEPLAAQGRPDPYFRDYEVHFYRTSDGELLRRDFTTENWYDYTYERNVEDNMLLDSSGPTRGVTCKVWARGRRENKSVRPATIVVSNPQHGLPTTQAPRVVLDSILLDWTIPEGTDFAGMLVWLSTDPDFIAGDENLIFDGAVTPVHIKGLMGVPHYIQWAAYDSFGIDGIIKSGKFELTPLKISNQEIETNTILAGNLHSSLNSRIDLIDASSATIGSVAWYFTNEQTARINAVNAEASTRADAVLAEQTARINDVGNLQTQINTLAAASSGDMGDVLAAIEDEAVARAAGDTANATQTSTLATQLRGAYTGTDITAVTTGLVWSEREARVTAVAAEATARSALAVTVTNNYNTLNAAITSEQTARISGDNALTSSLNALTTTVNNNTSAITTEATTRANADSVLASNISSVLAIADSKNRAYKQTSAPGGTLITGDLWFDSDDNNKLYRYLSGVGWEASDDARIAANAAAITSEATARANGDSANASLITSLTSTVTNNYNTLNSAITSEATTRANQDGVLASNITTIQTTVNGHTSSISTQATSINGLNAQYTVKVDVNGYVAGYGLATTANNGVPTSEFIVRADKFAIGAAGLSTVYPFIVVGGVTYISAAVIKAASITDAMIVNVSATKIIASSLALISPNMGNITGGDLTLGSNKFHVDNSGNMTVRSATFGARVEMTNSYIKVYDESGVLRVQLGDLTA